MWLHPGPTIGRGEPENLEVLLEPFSNPALNLLHPYYYVLHDLWVFMCSLQWRTFLLLTSCTDPGRPGKCSLYLHLALSISFYPVAGLRAHLLVTQPCSCPPHDIIWTCSCVLRMSPVDEPFVYSSLSLSLSLSVCWDLSLYLLGRGLVLGPPFS